MRAKIVGTGSYVPERVVTNDELHSTYGIETDDAWIRQRTGIASRRFAPDGIGTADLGLQAAQRALDAAGWAATDLDLILFATLSPEHCFPGSGVYLQEKLGLPDAGVFVPALDIRNQCSGFLYGLSTAAAHIQAGMAKKVLLVGAEVHSHALDLSSRGRAVACLFGDGAGAVCLAPSESGVEHVELGADGRHADALAQQVWDIRNAQFMPADEDGIAHVPPDVRFAQMDGRKVFRHAVRRLADVIESSVRDAGLKLEDIDIFLLHQANLRINAAVMHTLGIPSHKARHNIQRYGNTTAATIPLLLDEVVRDGTLQPGMRYVMAAFGSGFTWGSAVGTY